MYSVVGSAVLVSTVERSSSAEQFRLISSFLLQQLLISKRIIWN